MLSLKESVAFDTGTLIWSGQIAADYNHVGLTKKRALL